MSFPQTIDTLARALQERGYEDPTPVQLAVLQEGAQERDQLVSAQTGSGKTVAYGIAIATTLLGENEQIGPAAEPLALIVAPTRELALQVQKELIWLYAHTGARIITCVGGMDIRTENRTLERGAHIVIGTPGRLRDHLERSRLDASKLKAVVLDEADEMLNLGFREDLEFILEATPPERRTLMFSATIARNIATLAKRYQRDAVRIDASVQDQGHNDIEYRAIRIAPTDIENAVVNVLRFYEAPATLIFCATREAVRRLQSSLLERGFSVVALSGELSQKERNAALQAMRDGHARVCVATDVAARGIDIPDLRLVIHADLPKEKETLQHRSGRTGRAGKKGTCILLVPYTRRRMAERLLDWSGIDAVWASAPSAEEIRQLDRDRLIGKLAPLAEESPGDVALAQSLMAKCSAENIALALIRLYSERLPSPEELIDHPALAEPVGPRGSREPMQRDKWRDGPSSDMVWFRINVGRSNNANPLWLLPMICRLGRVTKKDIGVIRIFDRDTRFEISAPLAARFAAAAAKTADEEVRIEPAGSEPSSVGKPDRKKFDKNKPGKKKFSKDSARSDRPDDRKVWEDRKPAGDRPYRDSEPKQDKRKGSPSEAGPKVARSVTGDTAFDGDRRKKPFHKDGEKPKGSSGKKSGKGKDNGSKGKKNTPKKTVAFTGLKKCAP